MFELFDPQAECRVSVGSNLPHWFQAGVTYFVTFRTDDSIPTAAAKRWHAERAKWLAQRGIDASGTQWRSRLSALSQADRRCFHTLFSRQYMENLDKGWGAGLLRRPEIVADSLLHFDGQLYHMSDFVVMPNHVHLLFGLVEATDIVAQCYSWKKFTATKINQAMGTTGRFWHEESFDHLVRSPEQFTAIRKYIAENPRQSRLGPADYVLYQM